MLNDLSFCCSFILPCGLRPWDAELQNDCSSHLAERVLREVIANGAYQSSAVADGGIRYRVVHPVCAPLYHTPWQPPLDWMKPFAAVGSPKETAYYCSSEKQFMRLLNA